MGAQEKAATASLAYMQAIVNRDYADNLVSTQTGRTAKATAEAALRMLPSLAIVSLYMLSD